MRVECYQIATEIDFSCYREIFHEIVNQCSKLPCLSLRNFYSHFSFRNYHSGQSAVINTSKKIPNEGSDDCQCFQQKGIFNRDVYVVFLDIMQLHTEQSTEQCKCNFYMSGKPKNLCDSLYCNIYFIGWSQTKSTISPKYTCNLIYFITPLFLDTQEGSYFLPLTRTFP